MDDPWLLPTPALRPGAVTLFCLPHAGGGAALYRGWQALLPPSIRLCRIQLPGRETRFTEAPITSMPALIDALLPRLLPHCEAGPFALFGHSMGGSIAAELARRLEQDHALVARHLFLAAARPPHIRAPSPIHALPPDEFRAALARLGGTPPAVLEHDELMAALEPAIRADHALIETWHEADPVSLAAAITCIAARDDTVVPHGVAAAWRQHAAGTYRQIDLDAGHFFLRSHQATLIAMVAATLAPVLETTA